MVIICPIQVRPPAGWQASWAGHKIVADRGSMQCCAVMGSFWQQSFICPDQLPNAPMLQRHNAFSTPTRSISSRPTPALSPPCTPLQLLQSSSPPQAALTPSSRGTPCSTPRAPAHNTVGSKPPNKCANSPGAPVSSNGSQGGKSDHASTCNEGGEVGNGGSGCAKGLFQGLRRRATQDQNLELVCDIDYDRLSQVGAIMLCTGCGHVRACHGEMCLPWPH